MTKVESIELRRHGMADLFIVLEEYYKCNNNSFQNLSLDELINIVRRKDKDYFNEINNVKEDYPYAVSFECCRNCNEVKPVITEK